MYDRKVRLRGNVIKTISLLSNEELSRVIAAVDEGRYSKEFSLNPGATIEDIKLRLEIEVISRQLSL